MLTRNFPPRLAQFEEHHSLNPQNLVQPPSKCAKIIQNACTLALKILITANSTALTGRAPIPDCHFTTGSAATC